MFNFEKEVIEDMSSMKVCKYDALLPAFDQPGTIIMWDESEVKRNVASQISTRLNLIGKGKVFHSGFDTKKKKSFVRLKTDEEIKKDKP